jgi:hypothetical protein
MLRLIMSEQLTTFWRFRDDGDNKGKAVAQHAYGDAGGGRGRHSSYSFTTSALDGVSTETINTSQTWVNSYEATCRNMQEDCQPQGQSP